MSTITPGNPQAGESKYFAADPDGGNSRMLKILLPGGKGADADPAVREILSWDRNGDGDVDYTEVREASLALMAARDRARAWKRGFFLLGAAAFAAIAVLFGVTMATNELSKESKADPVDDAEDASLETPAGNSIAVSVTAAPVAPMFDWPGLDVADIAAIDRVTLPVSAVTGDVLSFSVTGFNLTLVANDDAENATALAAAGVSAEVEAGEETVETVLTLFLAGGHSLEIAADGASLELADEDETSFSYSRTPVDPVTGAGGLALDDAAAESEEAEVASRLRAAHIERGTVPHHPWTAGVLVDHADGTRRHMSLGDHEAATGVHPLSLRSFSPPAHVASTPGARADLYWNAPEPLPGSPSFTFQRCIEFSTRASPVGALITYNTLVGNVRDTRTKFCKYAKKYIPKDIKKKCKSFAGFEHHQCQRRMSVSRCKKGCKKYFKSSKSACYAICEEDIQALSYGTPVISEEGFVVAADIKTYRSYGRFKYKCAFPNYSPARSVSEDRLASTCRTWTVDTATGTAVLPGATPVDFSPPLGDNFLAFTNDYCDRSCTCDALYCAEGLEAEAIATCKSTRCLDIRDSLIQCLATATTQVSQQSCHHRACTRHWKKDRRPAECARFSAPDPPKTYNAEACEEMICNPLPLPPSGISVEELRAFMLKETECENYCTAQSNRYTNYKKKVSSTKQRRKYLYNLCKRNCKTSLRDITRTKNQCKSYCKQFKGV